MHGSVVAAAAERAVVVGRVFCHDGVWDLMCRCHATLRKSGGAALSLAVIDAGCDRLTWVGVGNVECVLFRADAAEMPQRELLRYRGGVVGYQMPSVRTATLPNAPGDMMVFANDGIASRFCEDSPIGGWT